MRTGVLHAERRKSIFPRTGEVTVVKTQLLYNAIKSSEIHVITKKVLYFGTLCFYTVVVTNDRLFPVYWINSVYISCDVKEVAWVATRKKAVCSTSLWLLYSESD